MIGDDLGEPLQFGRSFALIELGYRLRSQGALGNVFDVTGVRDFLERIRRYFRRQRSSARGILPLDTLYEGKYR